MTSAETGTQTKISNDPQLEKQPVDATWNIN